MLDAFIIEELKRREDKRRRREKRPVLELPVNDHHILPEQLPEQEHLKKKRKNDGNTDVVIIDFDS